jgi:hypothetical protein
MLGNGNGRKFEEVVSGIFLKFVEDMVDLRVKPTEIY